MRIKTPIERQLITVLSMIGLFTFQSRTFFYSYEIRNSYVNVEFRPLFDLVVKRFITLLMFHRALWTERPKNMARSIF